MILSINRLRVRTTIGVYDWEKTQPRDVIVTLHMRFNPDPAIESDDIADAIDYDAVSGRIQKDVEPSQYYLIEKLAARILEIVFEDPKVEWAQVVLEKPGVPALAESVAVTLEKGRDPSAPIMN